MAATRRITFPKQPLFNHPGPAALRDWQLPIFLARADMTTQDAVALNTSDVLSDGRITRMVYFHEGRTGASRINTLHRDAREALAIILAANLDAGYPMEADCPVFIDIGGTGLRMTPGRMIEIIVSLESCGWA